MSRSTAKLIILFLIVVGSVAGLMHVGPPENAVFGFLLGMFGMQLLIELRS